MLKSVIRGYGFVTIRQTLPYPAAGPEIGEERDEGSCRRFQEGLEAFNCRYGDKTLNMSVNGSTQAFAPDLGSQLLTKSRVEIDLNSPDLRLSVIQFPQSRPKPLMKKVLPKFPC
jgi:hypothetical protein